MLSESARTKAENLAIARFRMGKRIMGCRCCSEEFYCDPRNPQCPYCGTRSRKILRKLRPV